MELTKCIHCDKEFNDYSQVRKHISKQHKIHSSETYVVYFLKGNYPTCKCGCGEKVRWKAGKFRDFINGHNSNGKTNPMYGKHHTEEVKKSISKLRKEKFANGTYRVWQNENTQETRDRNALIGFKSRKENNPERAKKISNALKGIPKSKEHIEKMKLGREEYWRNRCFNKETKIETIFKQLLTSMDIEYEFQYRFGGYLFDFFIPSDNLLIEVDGDFYHSNPLYYEEPKFETQLLVRANDIKKNKVAKDSNMKLLRFWETDINDNIEQVSNILIENLNEKV